MVLFRSRNYPRKKVVDSSFFYDFDEIAVFFSKGFDFLQNRHNFEIFFFLQTNGKSPEYHHDIKNSVVILSNMFSIYTIFKLIVLVEKGKKTLNFITCNRDKISF